MLIDNSTGCPLRDPRFPATWPPHMVPVNATLFALNLVWLLGGAGLLLYFRNLPFVRERGFGLQLLGGFAIFMETVIVYLRDAVGRDTFPCDAYLWFSTLVAPIFCASVWVRLVIYRNKVNLAEHKAHANLELLNTNIIEHKRLKETKLDIGGSSSSNLASSARKLAKNLNPQPVFKAAASSMIRGIERHGSIAIVKVYDLAAAKALTGERFAFMVFVIILSPFIISIAYRYATVSVFGNGCVGCILGIQESWMFFGAIITIVLLGLLAVGYWRLYKDPDPLWILHELLWTTLIASVFTISAIVIDVQNPGNLFTSGTLSWGYLICIGTSIAFGLQTYYVVFHGIMLDRRRRSVARSFSFTSVDASFEDVLANPEAKEAFAEHLKGEFAIENLKFYERVIAWEKSFETSNPQTRNSSAEAIYHTFIEPDAPLEINISSTQREPLIRLFSQPVQERGLDAQVFEVAKREVLKLMSLDSFTRFKSTAKFASLTAGISSEGPLTPRTIDV